LLEMHNDLLPLSTDIELPAATNKTLVGQTEQKSLHSGGEESVKAD